MCQVRMPSAGKRETGVKRGNRGRLPFAYHPAGSLGVNINDSTQTEDECHKKCRKPHGKTDVKEVTVDVIYPIKNTFLTNAKTAARKEKRMWKRQREKTFHLDFPSFFLFHSLVHLSRLA